VYGPPTDVEPAEHELEADAVSTKRLQKGLRRLLKGRDLASTTIGQLRSELETLLELEAGALADRSQELKNIVVDHINQMKAKEEVEEEERSRGRPEGIEPVEHQLEADAVSTKRLQKGLRRLLKGRDLASINVRQLRSELETLLELESGALADRSKELKNIIKDHINRMEAKEEVKEEALEEVKEEAL